MLRIVRVCQVAPPALLWNRRCLVSAAPLGFGVNDPAARGGRLQTLGLCSASLASPLVALGRAFVQLRVPAVPGNLKVGGFAPLRLGLGEPV
jgi:hypothetical protein